ncbi:Mitogen-activated kinase kinase kinase A [Paramuricea clavata]|uniref:Mitogen-activated kinase kinase kinase A n=1 Tax=Paramuricea clavata TaxID=317549 RepID=A0A7D9HSS9_PARCT|nr:Mitogen-activated kinase kinase kinase A [Paramuricea clavata]
MPPKRKNQKKSDLVSDKPENDVEVEASVDMPATTSLQQDMEALLDHRFKQQTSHIKDLFSNHLQMTKSALDEIKSSSNAWEKEPIRCKLADFGESRSLSLQTNTLCKTATNHITRGTPVYRAPETFSDDTRNGNRRLLLADLKAIDVWSLGMVFFNLLNPDLKHPYQREITSARPKNVMEFLEHLVVSNNCGPQHSDKYSIKQATDWIPIWNTHKRCTSVNSSNRPKINEIVQDLERKEVLDRCQDIPLSVSQNSILEEITMHTTSHFEDDNEIIISNDRTNSCSFLSVNFLDIAALAEDVIKGTPFIVSPYRKKERQYDAMEAFQILRLLGVTDDEYYLTEEITAGYGVFTASGRLALVNAMEKLFNKYAYNVGIYMCGAYTFTVGCRYGQYFVMDTHSISQDLGGDGNGEPNYNSTMSFSNCDRYSDELKTSVHKNIAFVSLCSSDEDGEQSDQQCLKSPGVSKNGKENISPYKAQKIHSQIFPTEIILQKSGLAFKNFQQTIENLIMNYLDCMIYVGYLLDSLNHWTTKTHDITSYCSSYVALPLPNLCIFCPPECSRTRHESRTTFNFLGVPGQLIFHLTSIYAQASLTHFQMIVALGMDVKCACPCKNSLFECLIHNEVLLMGSSTSSSGNGKAEKNKTCDKVSNIRENSACIIYSTMSSKPTHAISRMTVQSTAIIAACSLLIYKICENLLGNTVVETLHAQGMIYSYLTCMEGLFEGRHSSSSENAEKCKTSDKAGTIHQPANYTISNNITAAYAIKGQVTKNPASQPAEEALDKAWKTELHHAKHIQCIKHFEGNCKQKLHKIGIQQKKDQKVFLEKVFGVQDKSEGMVDAEDKNAVQEMF